MLQLQPLPTRRLTEKAVQESAGAVGKKWVGNQPGWLYVVTLRIYQYTFPLLYDYPPV
jgi:hypothetical protein